MKKYKYVALFAVLVSILTIRAGVVTHAEDGDSVSATANANANTKILPDRGGIMTPDSNNEPEQGKNLQIKTDVQGTMQTGVDANREEMQGKIDAMRQEAKVKMDALKASIKSEKDNAKAKIEGLRITGREKVLNRFDEVVKNITNLEVRVNAQISALDAKDVDTTSAKASIAIVDTNITTINTKIASANTLLAKSASELTTDDKTTLKTLASDIQTLVKSTRQSLSDAVKSLKVSIANKK